jgi:hypothetical protein
MQNLSVPMPTYPLPINSNGRGQPSSAIPRGSTRSDEEARIRRVRCDIDAVHKFIYDGLQLTLRLGHVVEEDVLNGLRSCIKKGYKVEVVIDRKYSGVEYFHEDTVVGERV